MMATGSNANRSSLRGDWEQGDQWDADEDQFFTSKTSDVVFAAIRACLLVAGLAALRALLLALC